MKLIILDRDGVINVDRNYVYRVEDFEWVEGARETIARFNAKGWWVFVVTNQSGIARGYYDVAQLTAINEKILRNVQEAGGCIDFVTHCPHMPDAGCACRKPEPGMLLAIAKHFNCSLENVPFIGDRVSDIQAAEAAGALPMVVLSPMKIGRAHV